MTSLPPEEFVDPTEVPQVATVLHAVLTTLGVLGLGDLLARFPGTRIEVARASGRFRRALPASVWLSPEHQVVLTDPVVHIHIVGGVVLARDELPAGRLPEAIARLLTKVIADQGSQAEAAVILTAAQESCIRLRPY